MSKNICGNDKKQQKEKKLAEALRKNLLKRKQLQKNIKESTNNKEDNK